MASARDFVVRAGGKFGEGASAAAAAPSAATAGAGEDAPGVPLEELQLNTRVSTIENFRELDVTEKQQLAHVMAQQAVAEGQGAQQHRRKDGRSSMQKKQRRQTAEGGDSKAAAAASSAARDRDSAAGRLPII